MFREPLATPPPGTPPRATKVGVLTFHRCINYGSYWQARCLVDGLRAHGFEAVLLDYASPEKDRVEWRCALQPLLPRRSARADIRLYARKARAFQEAIAGLPLSAAFPLDRPEQMPPQDLVVVGSDEVWNFRHPWYGGQPAFFGSGVPAGRIVSYAASFGNYDADAGIDPRWADRLGRFDAISVRDDNSRRLVGAALGSEPPLVLDPCLQFPPALADEPEAGVRDGSEEAQAPYAAVYGHGFPDGFAEAARAWASARGLRLVSIGYRNDWADVQLLDAGPAAFARLIAGAGAVLTNFFHGCVFALLNAKPFACAASPYRMNKVRDLTQALGAQAHLMGGDSDSARLAAVLDAPPADAILGAIDHLRQNSDRFLRAVLA